MKLTDDSTWCGLDVSRIKDRASQESKSKSKLNEFRLYKAEISLWNKLSDVIHKTNPDITTQWDTFSDSSHNHITGFIHRIFKQVMNEVYDMDKIGKIEIKDDGTRGSAKTFHMILWNPEGTCPVDVADIHCNKYYYM